MSFVADIQANIDNFQTNLDRAQARMDQFADTVGRKIANLGSKFQLIGGAISIGVTAPLTAAGIAAFKMAADFEDALGATDQIFKEASESTQNWANSLPTYFGIAKKEALEYSNMMGSMLVNIGNLTEKEASKQSAKLIELAGDLTAMYGGTTQDAVRALTGALKGNTTMLDNYGMAANDALVKAKAYSMGLVEQGKELDLASKQAATLALIYEQSSAAQGQAAREAEGASGSMRAFTTEVTNLSTELGSVLLPLITPLISRVKDIIAGFRELSPETQKIIVYVGAAAAALGPLLLALGTIMQLAPLVGTAFAAMTGPIGITVVAIGAAVALIIKYWDEIKVYFTSGGGSKIWDNISAGAKKLWENLVEIFNSVREFVTAVWNKIGSNVMSIVGNTFDTVFSIIGSVIGQIIGVLTVFTSLIKGDFSGAFEAAKNVVRGIFNAIKTIVINVISNVSNAIAGFLKLIGADGLGSSLEGWANGLKPVKEQTEQVAAKVVDVAAKVDNHTKKIVSNTEALDKNKKKQVDYRKELTNTLASWGVYEAKLKVLEDSYKGIEEIARKAGASQEQFQLIASKQWADKALLNFEKIGEGGFSSDNLTTITGGFTMPIKLNPVLNNGQYEKVISNIKLKAIELAKKFNEGFNEIINTTIADSIAEIAASIGGALASGDNLLKSVGSAMLGTLGGVLTELGKMAIQTGIGIKAIQLALKSLNPYVAIAAGVALVALGSAFKSGASNLANSGSSGSVSGGLSSSSQTIQQAFPRGAYYNNDKQEVEFKLRGNDLVGAMKTNNNRNKRLG